MWLHTHSTYFQSAFQCLEKAETSLINEIGLRGVGLPSLQANIKNITTSLKKRIKLTRSLKRIRNRNKILMDRINKYFFSNGPTLPVTICITIIPTTGHHINKICIGNSFYCYSVEHIGVINKYKKNRLTNWITPTNRNVWEINIFDVLFLTSDRRR